MRGACGKRWEKGHHGFGFSERLTQVEKQGWRGAIQLEPQLLALPVRRHQRLPIQGILQILWRNALDHLCMQ